MIIQCPACGARAKLPDSKEGAKVRCVECERVYVAGVGAGGGSGRSTGNNTGVMIGVGAAVVGIVLVLFIKSRSGEVNTPSTENAVIAEAPTKAPPEDLTGWESKLVKRVRDLHGYAFSSAEFDLQSSLAWPQVWARTQGPADENGPPPDTSGYEKLNAGDIDLFRGDTLKALVAVSPDNLVGSWKPFNGEVISEGDDTAAVRLDLEPRDESIGTGTRAITWKLVKDGAKWKAWSWDRYQTADELKPKKTKSKKNYERKTLSDGSEVIEGEPGPLEYMDSTPAATRTEIDALILKLVDMQLPARQLTEVKEAIVGHGKDAVPPLLTKFYELNKIGFDNMDQAIAAQLVHSMLSDITGYVTTFSAHEALGATEERRESGVRQWFGWYDRKFAKFEVQEPEDEDLQESLDLMSDAERREYEKTLRQLKSDQENKNPHRKNN